MQKKDWIIGGAILLALIMAGVGIGGNDQSQITKQLDSLSKSVAALSQQIGDSISFGGSPSRLPHGYWDTADGYYVDGRAVINGNGAYTGVATSTFGEVVPNVSINITQAATTTAANPPSSGYVFNTGGTKLCSMPTLWLTTANGMWSGKWAVGTTTLSGDSSLLNTTTATLVSSHYVNTTTVGIIGHPDINGGSYFDSTAWGVTSTPWVWKNGEALVVSNDYGGATSSEGFTSVGGFTTPLGKLVANCWNAY